jgi:hypothetical protein
MFKSMIDERMKNTPAVYAITLQIKFCKSNKIIDDNIFNKSLTLEKCFHIICERK